MATPASPDKSLVVSPSKDGDNTGWILAAIRDQKEYLLALIESNDVRYGQRFDASKEAITSALNAAKEAITAALSAADRAVQKAEAASEKRFEGVNEFRETLADQQRTLMPRTEAEVIFASLTEKIESVTKDVAQVRAMREGAGQGWGWAVGIIGFIATILSIIAVGMVLFRARP